MYLKRLEMIGFKSFADAFELEFRRGISCIVGPNGCGKSNVADAIRWALGSQSPSELRADRMEDVIFSGTSTRKSQGMAEVILTFDNSSRALNLDFDEITVTRRLFRSGESEYLLNGNRCRLMDITDLLIDRGLGSNGYWILERNMTRTIIESGPSDRRFLFDEAAGIVKYKMQRHRAELKLNAVAADLERLDDIIDEVERNAAQLKRQVAAYRRWEKAERNVREIEGLVSHRVLQDTEERLDGLRRKQKTCASAEERASAAAKAAAGRQSSSRVALEEAQSRLDREHERCAALDAEMGRVNRELAVAEERLSNIATRTAALERSISGGMDRVRLLEQETSGLEGREKELAESLSAARGVLEAASAETAGSEERCRATGAKIETGRRRFEELSDRMNSLQKEYAECLRMSERASQELQHALDRKAELDSEAGRTEGELEAAGAELEGIAAAGREIESLIAGNRSESARVGRELEEVRSSIHSLDLEHGLLKARVEKLRNAAETHKPEGASLSSRIRVKEGMAMAVGAWLDVFQDATVCGGPEELPDAREGERFFVGTAGASKPELPPGAVWLPECLEENSDSGVSHLLAGAVLAPDRSTALNWFLEGLGLDVVTCGGDLFRRDGLVRLGVPEEGGGSIDRDALITAAADRERGLSSETGRLRERESSLLSERAELEASEEALRRRLSETAGREATLRSAVSVCTKRLEGISIENGQIEERIPLLREASAGHDPSRIASEMEECGLKRGELSSELKELEELRESLAAELNGFIRMENDARLELASLESSLKQCSVDRERLASERAAALEAERKLREELEELKGDGIRLEEAIRELKSEREALSGQREEAEKDRRKTSGSRAEWLEKSKLADQELSRLREELAEAREERMSLEAEIRTLDSRCGQLRSAGRELPEEESRYWGCSLEKLEMELEKQRGYRENLGPVNMIAVAEYEEANRRVEFLTGQRKDLDQARESLLGAIAEINRTAAKRFEETFAEVRERFKEMFTLLFGGGEADIIALESDDPLEGGVQIVARPPGKKMENITALSSGERAMTAAALLFALYLVKPSPFCVLDELDAPLDDSNVDSFVNLLKGFVHRTQFIVITHNKRTMEAADRLFGITMAEQGVSTLTTVSFEKAIDIVQGKAQ